MKLNPNKIHPIIVSRSKTAFPQHPPLSLCGVELEISTFLKLFEIVLDKKLTFEMHICNIASSIAQKASLIRKCFKAFGNDDSVLMTFYAFILPCFEYCSPVWCSGSDSHLRLLDRTLGNIPLLLPDLSVHLEYRKKIANLSLLYKIFNKINHPLHCIVPQFAVPLRATRQTSRQNERTIV